MVVTSVLAVRWFLAPHLRMLAETYDVTLLVRNDYPDELADLDLPVRVIDIPIAREISPLADLLTLFRLWLIFRREKFDLVHTVTPKAGLLGIVAAWLAGIRRRVHTFQGELWVHRRGFMRWLLRVLDKLVGRAATHLTVVSQSELAFLEAEGILPAGKGQVLGAGSICGVDLERFRADPQRRAARRGELGVREGTTVFLFLGRLCTDKGIPTLAAASAPLFAAGKDIALLVVGPDEERMVDLLETYLRPAAGDRLKLFPFTRSPEDFLAPADVLVLPSVREGFGMVILEAAAMGLPSIGTDIYGIRDAIVAGDTGLLFPLGNVQALSMALTGLSDDPVLRARLGEAARRRAVGEFAQERIVAAFHGFCFSALGR
jgi:glycosyltransferase involved in cell wall biosynthesis